MRQCMRAGTWLALLAVLGVLAGARPASAQSKQGPPVAVISLVWGVVTVKHTDGDYKPAMWLEPIYAQDLVKTAGPGSKLLITYFFDNHQEVLGVDSEATVGSKTLASVSGGPIRCDKPRNPFGQGMENPFVYTMRLDPDSFKGADAPQAMGQENAYLGSMVQPTYPPTFSWPAVSGTPQYKVGFFDTTGATVGGATARKTSYRATTRQFSLMSLGQTFLWQVTTPAGRPVVARYAFMVLGRPQQEWLAGYRKDFQGKKKRGQLQRSDYTDYLLACAQLQQVDVAVSLCQEMARMNPRNPRVFRALTRAYLAKGCPAHAKQAYDQEIQLGGIDPLGP